MITIPKFIVIKVAHNFNRHHTNLTLECLALHLSVSFAVTLVLLLNALSFLTCQTLLTKNSLFNFAFFTKSSVDEGIIWLSAETVTLPILQLDTLHFTRAAAIEGGPWDASNFTDVI